MPFLSVFSHFGSACLVAFPDDNLTSDASKKYQNPFLPILSFLLLPAPRNLGKGWPGHEEPVFLKKALAAIWCAANPDAKNYDACLDRRSTTMGNAQTLVREREDSSPAESSWNRPRMHH